MKPRVKELENWNIIMSKSLFKILMCKCSTRCIVTIIKGEDMGKKRMGFFRKFGYLIVDLPQARVFLNFWSGRKQARKEPMGAKP